MEQRYVEILRNDEASFEPLVYFNDWRVAILNHFQAVDKDGFRQAERHCVTDEVFVLLAGKAFLLVGTDEKAPSVLEVTALQPKTVYNVKKNVWHHIVLSEESSVLIVENADTAEGNSEYAILDRDTIRDIRANIPL